MTRAVPHRRTTLAKAALGFECVLLFLLLPAAFSLRLWQVPPIPILGIAALYCLLTLLRDPSFDRRQLWNAEPFRRSLLSILLVFAMCALFLTACMAAFAPQLLFEFPRTRPAFWASVLVAYPVVSVYPQSIVYRAFFLHRYPPLFHSRATLILASAASFGFMHLVFRNPVAVVLTATGGILFAWRYNQTRSLAVSAFEHALYGCFLFTIGLGRFFYAASI